MLNTKKDFHAILTVGFGSSRGAISNDSNENEPEPEALSLVVPKEPKFDSGADSKAGITPVLVATVYAKVSHRRVIIGD